MENPDAKQGDRYFVHSRHDQVAALLAFMEIDVSLPFRVKLARSGKNVDSVFPIRNIGRGHPRLDDRARGGPPPKKFYKMTEAELDVRLRKIFARYYGPLTEKKADPARMDLVKCHKFLRDCKLLDNRIGFDEADRVFNQLKDKEDRINHQVFLSFVRGFAEKKYPTFPPEQALKVVYQDLFKYGFPMPSENPLAEELLDPRVLRSYKPYEHNFKYLFSHYATLALHSADVTSWKMVRNSNRTMSMDEVTIFLLNFDVFPRLISKRELKDIFSALNENQASIDFPDNVVYPEFLELIGRVAVVISSGITDRIINPNTSVDEMTFVKRYIQVCGADAREHFYVLLENRVGENEKYRQKLDAEARMKAAEQMRREREFEMEHMQRSQLAASRRELLSRVSSRWTSDGINTDLCRAMGGQAGGQVHGHGGMSFGPPPHASWTGRQPNPRSKTYLTHIRPNTRSKAKSAEALGITTTASAISRFIDADMDDQAFEYEWKRNFKSQTPAGIMGVVPDADLITPDIDNFERRLKSLQQPASSRTTFAAGSKPDGRSWTPPVLKLPGISDRRLAETFIGRPDHDPRAQMSSH